MGNKSALGSFKLFYEEMLGASASFLNKKRGQRIKKDQIKADKAKEQDNEISS